jgi:hypothetical protein
MLIEDYSMVNEGTSDEDCVTKKIRLGKGDLKGAIIKKISKDEIVIELQSFRKGDLVHIIAVDDHFEFTTLEGGKA